MGMDNCQAVRPDAPEGTIKVASVADLSLFHVLSKDEPRMNLPAFMVDLIAA